MPTWSSVVVATPAHSGLGPTLSYRSELLLAPGTLGARAAGGAGGAGGGLGRSGRTATGAGRVAGKVGDRGAGESGPLERQLATAGAVRGAVLPAQPGRGGAGGAAAAVARTGLGAAGAAPETAWQGGRRGAGRRRRRRVPGPAVQPRAGTGAGGAADHDRAGAAVWRHWQRQDRGLPAHDRRRAGPRPGGAGAGHGPGNQPDAAAGGAVPRALRRPLRRGCGGVHAQRHDAGAAALQLAGGAQRRGAHRLGHAHGDLRQSAGTAPHRGR